MLSGCQTHRLARRPVTQTPVDSSLYFEQVKIEDPFFYAIQEHYTQKISLEKVLIPEPATSEPDELEKFKEVDGYRVQVFAGVDSINALDILYQAESLAADSVYFIHEKGLYKIQVGDYQFYPVADSVKLSFRKSGYPGAWIVRRTILIPVKVGQNAALPTGGPLHEGEAGKKEGVAAEKEVSVTGRYYIQIMALLSEEKARLVAASLKRTTEYNSYYNKVGNLYKVFVGPFQTENEARDALRDVKSSGYPDAWLVY